MLHHVADSYCADSTLQVSREQAWCAVAIDVYRNCSDEVRLVFDSIDSHEEAL